MKIFDTNKNGMVREGRSSEVLLNIKGKYVQQGRGSKVLLNIKDDEIRKGRSSNIECNTTDKLNKIQLATVLFVLSLV